MPISSDSSLASSSAGSFTDRAVEFLSNIVRRGAVRYRVALVQGHRFEAVPLAEPTLCSHCGKVILWFLSGQQCKVCKFTIHKDCLNNIDSRCLNGQQQKNHKFEKTYFMKPTFCNHCGVLIKGLAGYQGLECASLDCNMKVHHDCKDLVCHPCCKRNRPKSSILSIFSQEKSSESDERKNWSRITIQDFELTRLLGIGSFSKVYLARLRSSDYEFAIKVIKKTNLTISSDPESVLSEMRALHIGRNYPFLTIAHCCFQSKDRLYFVMEYVIGRDLLYHLRKSRKFTEDRAKFYSAEIVLAIKFLHKQGVVYRDIKLENIIIEKHGHCKLLDFGMAKELNKSDMKTRTFCGTPSYISPEVIKELDYGYSVDWWALGVLMFEMLVGCSPFEAHSDEQLYKKIVGDEDVKFPRSLSVEARSILEGLLNKDPRSRLGCSMLDGYEDALLEHPFFLFKTKEGTAIHRWEELIVKQIPPPYIPTLDELENDGEFENKTTLTPINPNELKNIPQSEFDGFSYYSESFSSLAFVY